MKTGSRLVALLGVLGAFATGCGNVCDDADDICNTDEGEEATEPTEEQPEQDCSAAVECESQCVVDADSCDTTDPAVLECFEACS